VAMGWSRQGSQSGKPRDMLSKLLKKSELSDDEN
jgi:hypothetical protein